LANDRILLITGPAGAGKSSVAEAWASSRDFGCAQLSLDTFREFVKSGYHDPRNGWNDEAQRQLDLARSNMDAAATNYLSADIQVVIGDAAFPNWESVGLDGWNKLLPGVDIDLVVLMPDWKVVRERNGARDGQHSVPEDVLRIIYDDMAGSSRSFGYRQLRVDGCRHCHRGGTCYCSFVSHSLSRYVSPV